MTTSESGPADFISRQILAVVQHELDRREIVLETAAESLVVARIRLAASASVELATVTAGGDEPDPFEDALGQLSHAVRDELERLDDGVTLDRDAAMVVMTAVCPKTPPFCERGQDATASV